MTTPGDPNQDQHPHAQPPHALGTIAARAGEDTPMPLSRPLAEPLHQATVYGFADLEELEAAMSGASGQPFYYRNGHPNRASLERTLARLERTEDAATAASGMAAILGVFHATLRSGDHLLVDHRVYGGTYAMITQDLPAMGVDVGWVDAADLGAVEAAMRPNTKLVHVESLTNPLVTVADVPRLAEITHPRGALLSVDNTFAGPGIFRPAEHGADIITHSLAKYLGGHSTSMGGAVLGPAPLIADIRTRLVRLGATIGAFDAWMTHQGLKTLHLRMRAHSQNAQAVADVLENHPRVRHVHFPGLASHPQFDLATDLYPDGFGGMMAIEVQNAAAFVKKVSGRIPLAPSLSDVATTMSWPWGTSHRALPEERRRELGISPDLLRLSVGCEDIDDLLGDLEWGLED